MAGELVDPAHAVRADPRLDFVRAKRLPMDIRPAPAQRAQSSPGADLFMKKHLRTAILAALAAAAAATASAQTGVVQTTATQPGPGWSALKNYTGTIVQVDPTARRVTTRDAGGQTSVFEAPAGLASSELAGFRPGDMVTVTFYEGVVGRRKPAGEAPVATSVDPATGLRTATVTVEAIDPAARTVTFTGPRGRYTRTVPEGVDASMLRALTIGEKADLTYFEYVQSMARTVSAVASTAAPPAAPMPLAPDSLRNRLTVYALYGVDNQFSGKMIEAATGRTTSGTPINLDETTYDEVYGRMGMFKVGVGYRTDAAHRGRGQLRVFKEFGGRRGDPDRHGGHQSANATERELHRLPGTGASRAVSGGSSRACGSHRLSAGSPASTVTRTSAARSSACRRASHRASPPRMASSSKSRGRSASDQPVAS